jgi:putative MATE family efflux protein
VRNTAYFKDFLKYTSLNIIAMISMSLYILVDTFFISMALGPYGLAALNFALPVFGIVFGCGLMLGIGGATKYTIFINQDKKTEANGVFTITIMLMLGFSVLFVVSGIFFANSITAFLGAGGEVFSMSRDYVQILLIFAPALLINGVLVCFVRNDGAPKLAMLVMSANSLANIGFDYILIIQNEMGMFGAALATGLANIAGLLILSVYFIARKNNFKLKRQKFSGAISMRIFATGLPSFITEVSVSIVMIVFNLLIYGLSGNIGVAAFGVIANILIVIIAIYNGIAQGIQPLVSKFFGSGNMPIAKLMLRYALILMVSISAAVYLAVLFGANYITNIFNPQGNEMLQYLATTGMRIYFAGGIFAGFNIVLAMYFTSTQNPRPAHIISLLRGFIVILPLAFLLSSAGGITGVWFAFPITELFVCAIGCILYMRHKMRHAP